MELLLVPEYDKMYQGGEMLVQRASGERPLKWKWLQIVSRCMKRRSTLKYCKKLKYTPLCNVKGFYMLKAFMCSNANKF